MTKKKTSDLMAPKPEAKDKEPVIRKTTEYLRCEFTPDQLSAKAQELAMETRKLSGIEGEKASTTAHFAARIKECKGRLERLSDEVTTKAEMKNVECQWRLAFPNEDTKTLTRLDTGEIVRVDRMSDADRQLCFDDLTKDEKTLADKAVTPIAEGQAAENEEVEHGAAS